MKQRRCKWAQSTNQKMVTYHDTEWGVPVREDRKLFEFLVLEGAQAGLSWETILNKREGYKNATHNFNFAYIASHGLDVESLMQDAQIIRNRLKIMSIQKNAIACSKVIKKYGSFSNYLWMFVNDKPIHNTWEKHTEIPAITNEAVMLSNDLKKHGFTFVGPTICYAFMQAVGMVNDHTTDCFRNKEIKKMGTTMRL